MRWKAICPRHRVALPVGYSHRAARRTCRKGRGHTGTSDHVVRWERTRPKERIETIREGTRKELHTVNIPCPPILRGGLKSTIGGDNLAPCICPTPLGFSSKIDGRKADENVDFILAIFSFTPAVGSPLSTGWTPPPERFLFDGGGGAEPSAGRFLQGAGTLWGRLSGPRRLSAASPVGPPNAVIADGPDGIAPYFTSTAAAETPNECTELGQAVQASTIAGTL